MSHIFQEIDLQLRLLTDAVAGRVEAAEKSDCVPSQAEIGSGLAASDRHG